MEQGVGVSEAEDDDVSEAHSVELLEADGEWVTLAVKLGWLAVAETDSVPLSVGVWERVEQGVGVCEVEEEAVREGYSEKLLETDGEWDALADRLGWLAVAETDSVPLSVGVWVKVEQGVGVCEADTEVVCEVHPVELPEAVGEWVPLLV